VLTGEVHFANSATATALPHLRAQKIRALAVNTPVRLPALPGVPTMTESGYPGVSSSTWYGVLAPAGTPREIIVLLNRETNAFARSKAIVEKTNADGDRARGDLTPETFAKFIADDAEVMRKVIEPLKIRLD
jgi:tripartite-type tricarboxylate transporter receptor subunit TctC